MVPSTRHTLPFTTSIASAAVGTNSSSTALMTGTSIVTILDTVDCEISRMSPKNSCVPFCRRYIHEISTAWYSPHDFGRPDFLLHDFSSALWTRITSSCICDRVKPEGYSAGCIEVQGDYG